MNGDTKVAITYVPVKRGAPVDPLAGDLVQYADLKNVYNWNVTVPRPTTAQWMAGLQSTPLPEDFWAVQCTSFNRGERTSCFKNGTLDNDALAGLTHVRYACNTTL
jgi:hypothetical protein